MNQGGWKDRQHQSACDVIAFGHVFPNVIREPGFLAPGFRRNDEQPEQPMGIFQDLAPAFLALQ